MAMSDEERRERKRIAMAERRARDRAAGIKTDTRVGRKYTPEQTARLKETNRIAREKARLEGRPWRSELWAKLHPEKHAARAKRWRDANPGKAAQYVRKWRAADPERSKAVARKAAAKKRSTPWGRIADRVFRRLRSAVQANSHHAGKYNVYIGYLWSDLRAHLEAQFTPEMNWENWGPVWEVDHIKPVSSFQYQSLADPLFRDAWALSNLRPLLRGPNAAKGNRIAAE